MLVLAAGANGLQHVTRIGLPPSHLPALGSGRTTPD